jgi:hypothetical protein
VRTDLGSKMSAQSESLDEADAAIQVAVARRAACAGVQVWGGSEQGPAVLSHVKPRHPALTALTRSDPR